VPAGITILASSGCSKELRMAETTAFFAVKSIGLSRCGGRKPCTLLEAARHNLREIQAELGAVGRINATRSAGNIVMHGPTTAAEVQAQANALLAGAGINTDKLRRDHCQAIEIVFSLPIDAAVTDPAAYFERCLEWAAAALHLPVVSAVLHRDEQAPHLHVLVLPIRDLAHVGSAPIDRINLKRLRDEFFGLVAGPFGLKRQDAKVRGNVKQWAVAAVLSRCEAMGLPNAVGPLWAVLVAAIQREPTAAMLALRIDVSSIRPNPIGIALSPIGFDEQGPKERTLCSVGFASPTPPPKPQKPIGSLSELWLLVGCKLAAPRADRLRRARAAQQAAVKRHTRRTPTASSATDSSVTTRVIRDEHAHDLSAWD
jgi:hypothetical protein